MKGTGMGLLKIVPAIGWIIYQLSWIIEAVSRLFYYTSATRTQARLSAMFSGQVLSQAEEIIELSDQREDFSKWRVDHEEELVKARTARSEAVHDLGEMNEKHALVLVLDPIVTKGTKDVGQYIQAAFNHVLSGKISEAAQALAHASSKIGNIAANTSMETVEYRDTFGALLCRWNTETKNRAINVERDISGPSEPPIHFTVRQLNSDLNRPQLRLIASAWDVEWYQAHSKTELAKLIWDAQQDEKYA